MYGRTDDQTIPPLVSYRNPGLPPKKAYDSPVRHPYSNIPLVKDIMSLPRCTELAKSVKKKNKFPSDMHLVQ